MISEMTLSVKYFHSISWRHLRSLYVVSPLIVALAVTADTTRPRGMLVYVGDEEVLYAYYKCSDILGTLRLWSLTEGGGGWSW